MSNTSRKKKNTKGREWVMNTNVCGGLNFYSKIFASMLNRFS